MIHIIKLKCGTIIRIEEPTEITSNKKLKCECGAEMLKCSLDRHKKTDSHKLAMLKKLNTNMLDFLTEPTTKNIVITQTNNSHTTPYPSEDEDE